MSKTLRVCTWHTGDSFKPIFLGAAIPWWGKRNSVLPWKTLINDQFILKLVNWNLPGELFQQQQQGLQRSIVQFKGDVMHLGSNMEQVLFPLLCFSSFISFYPSNFPSFPPPFPFLLSPYFPFVYANFVHYYHAN